MLFYVIGFSWFSKVLTIVSSFKNYTGYIGP